MRINDQDQKGSWLLVGEGDTAVVKDTRGRQDRIGRCKFKEGPEDSLGREGRQKRPQNKEET